MCGRFSLETSAKDLAHQFKLLNEPEWNPRYNIAPTQSALMIRSEGPELYAASTSWGFRPPWLKDGEKGKPLINARAETASEKRTFSQSFAERRCLVPASSFFEWQKKDGKKLPWLLHLPQSPTFAIAGLWQDLADGPRFTILTLESVGEAREVHTRMPWILEANQLHPWLNGETKDVPEPSQTLGAQLQRFRVAPRVNKVATDDAECIAPLASDDLLF
jgi:putative SOS response-associated peptidase YedK